VAYRLVYVGLALLAVAAIAVGAAINRDGDPVELPEPLEAIFPTPGDSVIRQASVEVDLAVGYEATIYIDGVPVPNPSYEPATGVYRWAPSPASPVMTEWTPGSHTVRVEWIRVAGTPAVGHFEWSFRVN
jgi:hypothetical protein